MAGLTVRGCGPCSTPAMKPLRWPAFLALILQLQPLRGGSAANEQARSHMEGQHRALGHQTRRNSCSSKLLPCPTHAISACPLPAELAP